MNTPAAPDLVFSAEGFSAAPALVVVAKRKTGKLHRHAQPRIGLVRVRVTRETPRSAPAGFAVCITAHRTGAECTVHGMASDPLPAMDTAFRKLERLVTALSGGRKSLRRHPRSVELPAVLPKT